jgi:hypothetical protein
LGSGDLALTLGAHILILHDANASYESYAIRHGAALTVV